LRYDTDRAALVAHGRVVRHEIQSRARARVGKANAVWPDHTHPRSMREFYQTMLRLDAVGFGGLRETRGVYNDTSGLNRRGGLDHALYHRPRDAQHHAIRAFRHVRQ
jgi:hypothetical protein